MAVYRPKPAVTLQGPTGTLALESLDWGTAIGKGWDWRAQFAIKINPRFAREGAFFISGPDGLGDGFSTPPLVAFNRDTETGGSDTTELAGVCLASHKLRMGGQSFTSFRNTTSDVIIQQLGARAGLSIIGFPSWPVSEEDIKQAKLSDAFARWTEAAAFEWDVSEGGQIRCHDCLYTGGSVDMPIESVRDSIDETNPVDKLTLGKRTGISNEHVENFTETGQHIFKLPTPLSNCTVRDVSLLGYIDQVGFWKGDPSAGGALIEELSSQVGNLTVPVTATWPADYVSCYVYASPNFPDVAAAIKIIGSLPNQMEGVDPEFLVTVGSGQFGVPAVIDTILPSKAYAETRGPSILWLQKKGQDSITITGPLWAGIQPWQVLPYNGIAYRIDSVRHSCSPSVGRTRATAVRATL